MALKGLEADRAKIDEIAQIKVQLNPQRATATAATAVTPPAVPRKRHRMSAEQKTL